MFNVRLALSTAPDVATARAIVQTLVEESVIACGNILPGLTSIYRWQGEVQEAGEVLMILKTTDQAWPRLEQRLPELHPYDVPELLMLEVSDGLPEYVSWLHDNTLVHDRAEA